MTPLEKRYLGDGVFIASGAYVGEFILTTENGISVQNRIALDPDIIAALNRFVEDTREHFRRQSEQERQRAE